MARLLADNRDVNLSHDQVKHAETIETSGNDLLLLINDILDISKIEAGHVELQPRRVRIAPLTEKLTATFGPRATKKKSEERRVGKEGVSTWRYRWSADP